ncbi:MAG: hypothetical protein LKG40_02440 [Lachnospiraceae bacterium]|nr:hypothetical protein [Lachnospiraceae bacterium]MCI1329051.1 hypothetical protein [Lachnospiraceae bacterium]
MDDHAYDEKRIREIQAMKRSVLKSLESAPEGSLRCEMARGKYPQYYMTGREQKVTKRGRYLRKEELELARALAQKEYDLRMLEALKKQDKFLKRSVRLDETEDLKKIYEKLPEAKRRLVKPYVETDEEFVRHWAASFETGGNQIKSENRYLTEKGEEVRSKSEKMIADKLFYMKIPYIYEPALRLETGGIIFPDFVLLNVGNRKDYYFEHFGMMDSPEYCKKAQQKLDHYAENGIFPGEKLLISFESSQKGINMRQLELLMKRYLL